MVAKALRPLSKKKFKKAQREFFCLTTQAGMSLPCAKLIYLISRVWMMVTSAEEWNKYKYR